MTQLTIENRKDSEGWYVSDDGCQHNAFDYYMNGVFGFCGCGMPEDAMEFIRDGLQLVSDLKDKVWTDQITYAQWAENEMNLFGSRGQAYFFYYVLDSTGLTEHGGSVPGWLTDAGIDALHDIKIILSDVDKYRD